jgi:hypothetical protein
MTEDGRKEMVLCRGICDYRGNTYINYYISMKGKEIRRNLINCFSTPTGKLSTAIHKHFLVSFKRNIVIHVCRKLPNQAIFDRQKDLCL